MKKLLSYVMLIMITVNLIGCKAQPKEEVETVKQSEEVETVQPNEEVEKEKENVKKDTLYPDFILDETETTVTYMDTFGTETTVTKKPKKVVIAYNSILGLWYYTGGTALTKVKGSINVPEEAANNVDLGSTRSVSLEAIIALEPDLVILAANVEGQVAMAPTLNESGIETMVIDTSINAYERFKENAYLFSKINGTEDTYESKVNTIITDIDAMIMKAKGLETQSKVAAIFASSKSMSLDSDIALTGEIIYLLGGNNILNASDIKAEGETRVAFSIEALVTQNPEIIMISTMGKVEAVKENMDKMIKENPVWHEVEAVKNDRVYYLPKEYSVYKPNEIYAEAFAYIGSLLYPEVFGE